MSMLQTMPSEILQCILVHLSRICPHTLFRVPRVSPMLQRECLELRARIDWNFARTLTAASQQFPKAFNVRLTQQLTDAVQYPFAVVTDTFQTMTMITHVDLGPRVRIWPAALRAIATFSRCLVHIDMRAHGGCPMTDPMTITGMPQENPYNSMAIADGIKGVLSKCKSLKSFVMQHPGHYALQAPCTGSQLTHLMLDSSAMVPDALLAAFVGALPELRYISMDFCCSAGDLTMKSLAAHCPHLRYLSASHISGITCVGIAAIVKGLPRLQTLRAPWTGIANVGALAIASSSSLHLLDVDVSNTPMSINSFHAIVTNMETAGPCVTVLYNSHKRCYRGDVAASRWHDHIEF